jgi:hypothetical protein
MDLVAREQTDRRRFIWGRRGAFALGIGVAIEALVTGPLIDALVITGLVGGLLVAANAVTRRADEPPPTAQAALDSMRARARARLRLVPVVRGATVIMSIVTIALAIAHRERVRAAVVSAAASTLIVFVGTAWMARRIRGWLDRAN